MIDPRRRRRGARGVGGRRRGLRRRPDAAAAIRGHRLGYVLAVAANRRVPTPAGPIRVDRAARRCCPDGPGRDTPPGPAATASASTRGPGSRCWPKTTPTPAAPFADPPQRRHRRAGLPALLQPAPGHPAHPGRASPDSAGASRNPSKPPKA